VDIVTLLTVHQLRAFEVFMVCSPTIMAKVAGWLVAVALAACIVGACGGDDDASPGPTTAAVSPQATESAPTAAPTPPPSGAPTLTPSQAELAAGLPAAEELGDGWEEQSRGPATPTENMLCDEPFDFLSSDVLAGYVNLDAGHAYVVVGVSRPDETDTLGQARAALTDCDQLTSSAPGQPITAYSVEPAELDEFGDDTLWIKVTTQLEGSPQPSEGYFVLIQDGDLVLALADVYLVTADPAETVAIVAAAYEALQRVAE
jgi:hypothetical protein